MHLTKNVAYNDRLGEERGVKKKGGEKRGKKREEKRKERTREERDHCVGAGAGKGEGVYGTWRMILGCLFRYPFFPGDKNTESTQ